MLEMFYCFSTYYLNLAYGFCIHEFLSMNERLCFPATNQSQLAHQANGLVDMRCALRTDMKANVIGEAVQKP